RAEARARAALALARVRLHARVRRHSTPMSAALLRLRCHSPRTEVPLRGDILNRIGARLGHHHEHLEPSRVLPETPKPLPSARRKPQDVAAGPVEYPETAQLKDISGERNVRAPRLTDRPVPRRAARSGEPPPAAPPARRT